MSCIGPKAESSIRFSSDQTTADPNAKVSADGHISHILCWISLPVIDTSLQRDYGTPTGDGMLSWWRSRRVGRAGAANAWAALPGARGRYLDAETGDVADGVECITWRCRCRR
jgi:hypothetical protein